LRGLSAVFVDRFIDIAGGIASVIACFNSGEPVIDSFLLSTSTWNAEEMCHEGIIKIWFITLYIPQLPEIGVYSDSRCLIYQESWRRHPGSWRTPRSDYVLHLPTQKISVFIWIYLFICNMQCDSREIYKRELGHHRRIQVISTIIEKQF
jgi:hypothetical protein